MTMADTKPDSRTAAKPEATPADPAALAESLAQVAHRSSKLVTDFMKRQTDTGKVLFSDEMGIARAYMDLAAKLWSDPAKVMEMQVRMWSDYLALWQSSWLKMLGHEAPSVAQPHQADKRFKHDAWQEHFLYDFIKQSYLIAAKHLHHTVANVEGLDDKTAKKVDFYTRQYIDALAPTNFVLTNPEVLDETMRSGGHNLIRGLNNLLEDLERAGGEQVRLKMSDPRAFRLGENLAVTKGKVVWQNELMQLIQYDPLTEDVLKRPLLIVPPWINKFYILDMREKNSFVRWATAQGHTVFVISWVNPDAQHAQVSFENYMLHGPLEALDAIEEATGEREVNAIGYCLGGTLLASTLGYMAVKGDDRIASATYFVTMLDFSEPGELEVFIDDQQIAALEKKMSSRGYLEGHEMAGTFNLLRANDLIWSFVVNNYLLGKDPFPFDLLYWNSDSTRMPAAMHSFYLRNLYLRNLLCQPGAITLAGVPIDLSQVKVPKYFISTIEDHIAPWKSTYAGARLFGGDVRFVLGGSGHIAGIINPPAAGKYCYWTREGALPATADEWFAGATQHHGSWWSDWANWVAALAPEKVPARVPGDRKLPALEDAPGSYVKMRLEAAAGDAAASAD